MALSSVSRKLILAAAALAALAAGFFVSRSLHLPRLEATPAAAVDFALPDLDGRLQSLAQWEGHVVLLNFWATWCPPCREEIPLFIRFQERYAAQGLQILGVAIDEREAVAAYSRRAHINYPVLLGEGQGLALLARYGNTKGSLPYSVLIDRDGTIRAHKLGAFRESELEALLAPLMTRPPGARAPGS
jgi:thiol-disulfide isomerase/thioredoxin